MPRNQLVGTERAGQHLCQGYGSDQELSAAVCEFVKMGLAGGELVVHVTGSDAAALSTYLAGAGVDCEGALDRQQLRLIPLSDIEPDADGSRAAGLAALMAPILASRAAEGYPVLRVSSEVDSLVGEETIGQMIAREQLATTLTQNQPTIGMCFYDRRRFTGEFLRTAIAQHDGLVAARDGLVHLDPLLAVSRFANGLGLRMDGQVDVSNSAALCEALAALDDGCGEVTVDLSGLTFIDVGGLRALVEAARLHPQRSLVLLEPSTEVRTIFRLSGWDTQPNLVLEQGGDRR